MDSGSGISFAGSTVTATGNTATNGNGGFLYLAGGQTVTFGRTAAFISNTAGGSGGAIYAGTNSNLTFGGNLTTFNYNGAMSGGAIYLQSGTINFSSTNLLAIGNKANLSSGLGGFLYSTGAGSVKFGGVTMTSNTANSGGAVYAAAGTTLTFSGSSTTFNYNYAASSGGAVYIAGSNSSLNFAGSSVTFTSNTANSGGAVYMDSGNINFGGSVVRATGNTAAENGGFLYLTGQNAAFGEVSLISNTAQNGGAIYAANGSAITFAGSSTTINYNHSTSGNGVIWLGGNSTVNFSNTYLTAIGNTAQNGGFLYLSGKTGMTFKDVLMSENKATAGNGGALYIENSGIVFNAGVTMTSNTANSGGAVYAVSGTTFTFSESSKVFNYNSASNGGGFYVSGSSASFGGSFTSFTGNKATAGSGGAAYAAGGSAFSFTGTTVTFLNNSSSVNGGAVYSGNSIFNFRSVLTSFTGNSAVNGGAIYAVAGTTLAFSGSSTTFSSNTATGNGGALYLSGSSASFSGGFTEFTGNNSNADGGAVYVYDSSVQFTNALFTGNSAGGKGGAVYADSYSALYFYSNNGGSTTFKGNTASDGSGLYAAADSAIHFVTQAGSSVEMYDSIGGGANGKIFIEGAATGNFNLYADSSNNQADIYLSNGNFNFYNGANLGAGTFEISTGAVLNMKDGKQNILTVKEFNDFGTLQMDLLGGDEGDKIIASTVTLGSQAVLKTNISDMNFRKQIFTLIGYSTYTGTFGSYTVLSSTGAAISTSSYSLSYDYSLGNGNWIALEVFGDNRDTHFSQLKGITFNQQQTAGTYDALSESARDDLDYIISKIEGLTEQGQRAALAQASGYFIANVIRSGGAGAGNTEIYDRMQGAEARKYDDRGIWVYGKANAVSNSSDENSLNDYTDTSVGATVGYDFFFADTDFILGFFGRVDNHDIKQEPGNTASVLNSGLGAYGGYVKSSWDVKWLLSGSVDAYDTDRYIQFADRKAAASFGGMTINADIEAALKTSLGENTGLRYYAGAEMQNSSYNEIKESGADSLDLAVSGSAYQRTAARLGVSVNYEERAYSWYAGGEYKYLIDGNLPEIESKFENTNELFSARGSQEGKNIIGAKAGIAVNVLDNLKVFANAAYHTAERYSNIYGNIGVRLIFTSPDNIIAARAADLASAEKERLKAQRRLNADKEESARKEALREAKRRAKAAEEDNKRFAAEAKAAETERLKAERLNADKDESARKEAVREAERKAKEESLKLKEENKRLAAEIEASRKEMQQAEKERLKAEKAKKKEEALNSKALPAAPAANVPAQQNVEVKKPADTRIMAYEVMLAAEQKEEESKMKAEYEKNKAAELKNKQEQATAEAEKKKRMSSEISDEDLAKKKKEIEDNMLKPVLDSFEVKFMPGKYDLSQHWKNEIEKHLEAIKKYKYSKISIQGHTDSSEDAPKRLSRLRAKAIYDEFIDNGIPAEKMEYIGLSSVLPAASNSDEAGKMANRRVVVVVE